ncbi:MAG: hypothetical protein K6G65_10935, partial [Lachnospiraceae bacterium]|nr:hypothetical protein [Lachnospiraceae bacterium]
MEKEKVDLLPQWMQQEEIYDPPKDRELYISRSILSLLRVLLGIKLERGRTSRFTAKSSLSLFITVLFVLLTASSHNMVFIWLMVALVMLRISFLPIEVLKSVLKVVLSAVVFTVLVLLPSALLGATNAFFQITLKMIVSSALIGIFSGTRNWNQIT